MKNIVVIRYSPQPAPKVGEVTRDGELRVVAVRGSGPTYFVDFERVIPALPRAIEGRLDLSSASLTSLA